MQDHVANYVAPDPRSFADKLRNRMFPYRHCFAPEAPAEFKDCLTVRSVTVLSWADRLRVLLTGTVVCTSRTVTEHEIGKNVTAAICYVGTKHDQIHK